MNHGNHNLAGRLLHTLCGCVLFVSALVIGSGWMDSDVALPRGVYPVYMVVKHDTNFLSKFGYGLNDNNNYVVGTKFFVNSNVAYPFRVTTNNPYPYDVTNFTVGLAVNNGSGFTYPGALARGYTDLYVRVSFYACPGLYGVGATNPVGQSGLHRFYFSGFQDTNNWAQGYMANGVDNHDPFYLGYQQRALASSNSLMSFSNVVVWTEHTGDLNGSHFAYYWTNSRPGGVSSSYVYHKWYPEVGDLAFKVEDWISNRNTHAVVRVYVNPPVEFVGPEYFAEP